MKYKKTLSDLEAVAVKWWPAELKEKVAGVTTVPALLETQDKFLSILKISGDRPDQILELIAVADLAANMFLKHLVVLSDFGGEPIQRLGKEFRQIFPMDTKTGMPVMHFTFGGKEHSYLFKKLPVSGLSNSKLKIDGSKLVKPTQLDDLTRDMVMLLLHGGTSNSSHLAALEKCELGGYLGKPDAIDAYVKQKYLYVSRITTGATANDLGQIAQGYVVDRLRGALNDSYKVRSNGRVALKSYDSNKGMPFDVVVERKGKIVGVEVSFQVTSNSTIERKATNAEDRRNHMRQEGHYVAYVLDGAGNFSRSAALTAICQSSDCTVAYSDKELDVLVEFIQGKLDDAIH